MPVLACMRVKSKMLTPVVSLPVPAVVGIAMRGLSGPGTGKPFADGSVDVIEEIRGRIGGVEIHGLGGVDGGAAAHGDEARRRVLAARSAIAS